MIQEDLPFEDGRVCSKCKRWKLWSFFNKDRAEKTGHKSSCRDCNNVYKRRYENTPEGMYITYKRGAKARQYIWDITLEEFRQKVLMPCVYWVKNQNQK